MQRRSHRPDIESCNDPPHNLLVDEVATIADTLYLLEQKVFTTLELAYVVSCVYTTF